MSLASLQCEGGPHQKERHEQRRILQQSASGAGGGNRIRRVVRLRRPDFERSAAGPAELADKG